MSGSANGVGALERASRYSRCNTQAPAACSDETGRWPPMEHICSDSHHHLREFSLSQADARIVDVALAGKESTESHGRLTTISSFNGQDLSRESPRNSQAESSGPPTLTQVSAGDSQHTATDGGTAVERVLVETVIQFCKCGSDSLRGSVAMVPTGQDRHRVSRGDESCNCRTETVRHCSQRNPLSCLRDWRPNNQSIDKVYRPGRKGLVGDVSLRDGRSVPAQGQCAG